VALLASIPNPDPTAPRAPVTKTIRGEPPSPIDPPSGCRFRTRCPRAQEVCATTEPPLRKLADGHFAACHFPVSRVAPAPEASHEEVARAQAGVVAPAAGGDPRPLGNSR
jgi:oligopeptide/dipeptide ABC transporter ATP-binding protein